MIMAAPYALRIHRDVPFWTDDLRLGRVLVLRVTTISPVNGEAQAIYRLPKAVWDTWKRPADPVEWCFQEAEHFLRRLVRGDV